MKRIFRKKYSLKTYLELKDIVQILKAHTESVKPFSNQLNIDYFFIGTISKRHFNISRKQKFSIFSTHTANIPEIDGIINNEEDYTKNSLNIYLPMFIRIWYSTFLLFGILTLLLALFASLILKNYFFVFFPTVFLLPFIFTSKSFHAEKNKALTHLTKILNAKLL